MCQENKLYCERRNWGDSIAIRWMNNGAVATKVIFEQFEQGELIPAFWEMPTNLAQNLMDELWTCGLRPSEGSGSAGSLRATEKHLEDMRKFAFHKIIPKST